MLLEKQQRSAGVHLSFDSHDKEITCVLDSRANASSSEGLLPPLCVSVSRGSVNIIGKAIITGTNALQWCFYSPQKHQNVKTLSRGVAKTRKKRAFNSVSQTSTREQGLGDGGPPNSGSHFEPFFFLPCLYIY